MKNLEFEIQNLFSLWRDLFSLLRHNYSFLRDLTHFYEINLFYVAIFVFHILLAIWLKQIWLIFISFVPKAIVPYQHADWIDTSASTSGLNIEEIFLEISWQWTLETKNIYCQHLFGNYVNTFYAFVLNNCIIKSL